ncbi:MAG: hypothetical protein ACREMY_08930 [bacterium]
MPLQPVLVDSYVAPAALAACYPLADELALAGIDSVTDVAIAR